jgi:hypothetical protein
VQWQASAEYRFAPYPAKQKHKQREGYHNNADPAQRGNAAMILKAQASYPRGKACLSFSDTNVSTSDD